MSIIRNLIFVIALLLTGDIMAQNLLVDSIEYRAPYADLRPVVCQKRYTLDGDNKMHGTCRIKGSDVIRKAGYLNEQQYEETRTYRHGILEGAFSQTFKHNGHGSATDPYHVGRQWTAKGQFHQGHPDGDWTFSLHSAMHTGLENATTEYRYKLTFDHGRLTFLSDDKGHRITFHPDGTVSGDVTVNDFNRRAITLSHSVVSNLYQTAEGDFAAMTPELEKLRLSKPSSFAMADQGFAVDYKEQYVVQIARCADIVNRYLRLNALDTSLSAAHLTQIGILRAVHPVDSQTAYDYYIQTPGSADGILQHGYYERRRKKCFLNSAAEQRIRRHFTNYQCDLLNHKLGILVQQMENNSWDAILADCRSGRSPLLDMVAAQWQGPRFEDQCKETATLLDAAFQSLYPLRGFRIRSATYVPQKGLDAEVEFYVIKADSIQYTSVVVPLKTNPSGHILIRAAAPQ